MNFPQKVIALTRAIPRGKVLNYGRIAQLLDNPRAARAVGYALNALPHGSDVPWHRVVGKNGRYGKVSLRAFVYSQDEQRLRLEDEGLVFDENGQFVLVDYLWDATPSDIAEALEKNTPSS